MNTIRASVLLLVIIVSANSVKAEKVDAASFQCAFKIGTAELTQRYFNLNEDVYRCLRHQNYSDMALINSQGRAVWFRLTKTPDKIERNKFSKKLEYYSESSQAAFKTAAQIRRIAKLTGILSGQENEDQWRQKNAYYSSFIIDQQSDFNSINKMENHARSLKSLTINVGLSLLPGGRFRSDSVMLMVETSDDLRNWRSVIEPTVVSILTRQSGTEPQILKLPKQRGDRYLRIASMSHLNDFIASIGSISAEYEETNRESPELNWLQADAAVWNEDQQLWQIDLPYLIPISSVRFTHSSDIAFYQGSVKYFQYFDPMSMKKRQSIPIESGKDKLKRITKKALRNRHNRPKQSDWRYLSSFNQYQLITDSGVVKSPDISTRKVFSKKWGFNFKSPEDITQLELPGIEFAWQPQQLVFAAQGKGPFTLLVGRDEPVSWDHLPLLPKLLNSKGEKVSLIKFGGPERIYSNKAINDDQEVTSTISEPWYKLVLILLLGIGVLLLAYMAYRLSKSMSG